MTARGETGCSSTSSCTPQPGTVEVEAHVIFAGTRVASAKPTRTLYYYRTRLGTVIATSLSGGRPGAAYRYTPYGEVEFAVGETDETRSELGYTNALRLSGSLLYLKARVYDPQARVFIQADDVDRLRYAYVQGDPVNSSDPTGLLPPRASGTRKLVIEGATIGWIVTYDKDNNIIKTDVYDFAVPTERESFNNTQTALQLEAEKQRQPSWLERALASASEKISNWWRGADEVGRSKAAAAGAKAVAGVSAGFWRGAGDGSEETREGIARNADRIGSEMGAAAYNNAKDLALSTVESAAAGKTVGILGVILQKGGHTVTKATARALNKEHGLNLHPREWGDALEALKERNFLPNSYHGQIHLDGTYKSPGGEEIDNILNYLP